MKNRNRETTGFFNGIWRSIKIFFHRLWKKIEPDPVLTPAQQDIFDIFELYLNDDNNVRQLEPDSERKYIVSKNYILNRNMDDLFIMLDSRKITLIDKDNKQDYDNKSDLHEKTVKIMNEMFDEKVKQDRAELRDDLNKNTKTSLEKILDKLKKKKNEIV